MLIISSVTLLGYYGFFLAVYFYKMRSGWSQHELVAGLYGTMTFLYLPAFVIGAVPGFFQRGNWAVKNDLSRRFPDQWLIVLLICIALVVSLIFRETYWTAMTLIIAVAIYLLGDLFGGAGAVWLGGRNRRLA